MKKYYTLKIVMVLSTCIFLSCSVIETDQNLINEPIKISLHPYVSRLVTVNAIAGEDTLKLLLDTGGGETFIGPEVAHRLGCKPSGRSIGFRMSGETIQSQYCRDISLSIGGVTFHHDMIGVWDINSILPEELPPLDGILSLKTFSKQPFTLDLSSNLLILETKESLKHRTKAMTRLESRIATGPDGSELSVFLHGKIGEYDGWFLLDSGNLDVVLVSQYFVKNELSDTTSSNKIWESEFKFKNLSSELTRFRAKDIIYDGALSEEFIKKWIFTFDLFKNAVWISPVEK
ncbi:MAG: aspartyl protease family protein [Calditrichaceae bacterium]